MDKQRLVAAILLAVLVFLNAKSASTFNFLVNIAATIITIVAFWRTMSPEKQIKVAAIISIIVGGSTGVIGVLSLLFGDSNTGGHMVELVALIIMLSAGIVLLRTKSFIAAVAAFVSFFALAAFISDGHPGALEMIAISILAIAVYRSFALNFHNKS